MFKKVLIAATSAFVITCGTAIFNNHIRSRNNERMTTEMANSMKDVVTQLETISGQNQALILITTFRADPWSGEMMEDFQNEWFDLLKPIYPELKHSDIPNVKDIQKNRSQELIPPNFFEDFGKKYKGT